MTVQRRIKTPWPPELQAIGTNSSDINPLSNHTLAKAKKEGVYWIDAVQVWLGEGQQIVCPADAYVSYKGPDYMNGVIT